MKSLSRLSTVVILFVLIVSLTSARATSLLLDFGPTTVTATDAVRSPGHALNVVPSGEITWNKIQADTNALYYGDGTLATGVTLDLGRSQVAGCFPKGCPTRKSPTCSV